MKYEYDGSGGFRPEEAPGDSGSSRPRNTAPNTAKKNRDVGSWILIGFLFLIGAWPIGLFLLISKLTDRTASRNRAAASGKARRAPARVTRTPDDTSKSARVMKIIGAVLAGIGGMALLGVVSDLGFYLGEYGTLRWLFEDLFWPTGIFAGGIALLAGGQAMTRRLRRFAKYLAVAGKSAVVPIERLAGAAETPLRKVEKDLEQMIDRGMWGKGAYLDVGAGKLFRTADAAASYYDEKKAAEEVPKEAEEGYSGILREIRSANDRIADPELSTKIDRMEKVTGQILRLLENKPEKKAKAGTFLNYYLPTALKLLNSYAEFEATGISGENLDQAKEQIRRTMDNIVKGFEHQLDELYHADAMDIESDIRVMENMLRRDHSSVADDFNLNGTGAVQQQEE